MITIGTCRGYLGFNIGRIFVHDILHQYGGNILTDFEKRALFRLRSFLPPRSYQCPAERLHVLYLDLIPDEFSFFVNRMDLLAEP